MSKINVSVINFAELLPYKKALESLSPANQVGNLNASLLYSKDKNSLTLYVSDSTALAFVNIEATIEAEDISDDFGFYIDYRKFFDIIQSYKPEVRSTISMELALGPSSLKLFTSIDKLSLPHLEMNLDQVLEVQNSPLMEPPADFDFSLSQFEDRKDFLTGLTNCLKFIATTDKKNNALALYSDRLVVNDRRHIFIYNFETPIVLPTQPVSIHKLSAKILGALSRDTIEYFITQDMKRAIIQDKFATFVLNNSMSNIMPPSEEDLDSIRSQTQAFNMPTTQLAEIAGFFNQFYSSDMEQEPITLDIKDNALTFLLKDSGVVGYNSCNVERKAEAVIHPKEASTSTIINSSLRSFISLIPDDVNIDIFIDDSTPAVYLHTAKRKIYLAKLGWRRKE